MKRTLNPHLIWQKRRIDETSPFDEQWVFLRDPRYARTQIEVGIGPTEIEEVGESRNTVEQLRRQLQETEAALSTLSEHTQEREPHIVLTRDCFGFQGPVRLLICSGKLFSHPPHE